MAVIHMALLFGGTWIVNSVVIFAVLVMILCANLFVFAVKPERLGPYYAGLFLSLIISALVPMEYFLGMDRTAQIAGAMFGGLAEYSSMLVGFQYLLFVAVALYLVSMAGWRMAGRRG